MDGKKCGLRAEIKPEADHIRRSDVISALPAAMLLHTGTALVLGSWFPGCGGTWWQLLAGMILLSCPQWLLYGTRAGKWALPAGMALTAVYCLAAWKQVVGGIGCLGNAVLQQMTRVSGTIALDLAAAGGSGVWALVPICAVAAMLANWSTLEGKLLPLLPLTAVVSLGVITGLYPLAAGPGLLGLGLVLVLLRSISPGGWAGKPLWIGLLALCMGIAGTVGLFAGEPEPHNPAEMVSAAIHDMFSHQHTNSMPEGNLKNLRNWKKSDTPALEITMTQPQKLYLRGRVYETYTGTAWEGRDPELLAQQEDLFYWLHESGFYGQSQIGTASAAVLEEVPQTLTVRNLSACAETGYYPYALLGSDTLEINRIGDTNFPEAEQLTYLAGSILQWYEVQQELAQQQEDPAVAAYLAAEESYEAYVTEADLQLTNESWSVLKRQLGDEVSGGTLSRIRIFIRDYLEEHLVYDEKAKTTNGSGDFLQYTLEKSGSGYSVHYATAATLMLRYFGVPARYVEGYFLSAAEAEAYAAGEPIVLTEAHAHAWAEYYLPGVGFIPFEVTPGYIDDEESQLGGTLAESQQMYLGNHLQYAQVEQPERIEEPQQDRFRFELKPVYLLYLLIALLLLFLALVIRRRYDLKKALTLIEAAPNREAIAMRFGYAVKLLDCCEGVQAEGSSRAEALNREALFSNHKMTQQQRREMDDYALRVLAACKEKWTVPNKLRYRLWDCLY